MRFLHAADLHIDSPLRGLSAEAGAPVDHLRGATRLAFNALIDLAIRTPVDFVLLCGDIFDVDWGDYRTGLFFRAGLVRLSQAGIRVFLIQGNHDAQGVITRQLEWPSNTKVFSSRTAETARLDDLGVAIHGRSFPNRAVTEDLAKDYPEAIDGYFNIAMLHTSMGGRQGHDSYAPTTVDVLVSKNFSYWALGHVHQREILLESPWIVYPGNIQGRHANETGPKGCVLVSDEAANGRAGLSVEFVPLDVVRWSRIEIDASQILRPEHLGSAFREALFPQIVGAADRLHAVRVVLRGASPLHSVEASRPGVLAAHLQAAAQDVTEVDCWIERVIAQLSPVTDRAEAANRQDAVGELARLVDSVSASDEAIVAWVGAQLEGAPEPLGGDLDDDAALRLTDAAHLRSLLADAEATVLARLGSSGPEAAS